MDDNWPESETSGDKWSPAVDVWEIVCLAALLAGVVGFYLVMGGCDGVA